MLKTVEGIMPNGEKALLSGAPPKICRQRRFDAFFMKYRRNKEQRVRHYLLMEITIWKISRVKRIWKVF